MIRAAGAKFLPKYSPYLNPIEQVFAKLKHLLRKAATRPVESVMAAIGQLLGIYTSRQALLRHAPRKASSAFFKLIGNADDGHQSD